MVILQNGRGPEVVGVVSEAGLESGGGVNPGALIKPVQSTSAPEHLRGSRFQSRFQTGSIGLRNQKPRRTAVKVTTTALTRCRDDISPRFLPFPCNAIESRQHLLATCS